MMTPWQISASKASKVVFVGIKRQGEREGVSVRISLRVRGRSRRKVARKRAIEEKLD